MLYVKFEKEECPLMWGFLYVWFIHRYFEYVYKVTISNYKHMGFGQVFEFIKVTLTVIIHSPKALMSEYNIFINPKYESYMRTVKG